MWLTINKKGSARITKSKPGLNWDEVAIQLHINLPDALFNRPRLEAEITVPDEAAQSEVIQSAITDNVKDAIEQATGLNFSISIADPEQDSQ
jgi:hypothetical protein